ncbi:MAG: transposase [Candidatus Micrarchaeia archaeon]
MFKEMPDHRLRYPNGAFWSAGYGSSNAGPQTEEIVRNYIRQQDISGQMKLT